MQEIISLLKNEDCLVQMEAIEKLAPHTKDSNISSLLVELFYEHNYLVRCEAYDAFHNSSDIEIYMELLKRLNSEKSKCARMYLISTLCGITKNIGWVKKATKTIMQGYKKEKSTNVLLAYECLLYLYDTDMNRIYKVLAHLGSDKYLIRCNVINLLYDVIDNQNRYIIKKAYEERFLKEDAYAVKCLLEQELKNFS